MARGKKTNNKSQLKLKMAITDERVPKLAGIICCFIAAYLFVAFVSYIFTWQEDYDKAFLHNLLASDITMNNWLGRLGAIVSNGFFYWGFGISSFLFIGILVRYGIDLIKNVPLKQNTKLLWNSFLLLLFSSIFFAFIFQNSTFPWGGAFGDMIATWLQGFVGLVGMFILLFTSIIGFLVWFLNPDFRNLTFDKAVQEVKWFFEDLINGKVRRRPGQAVETAEVVAVKAPEKEEKKSLKPSVSSEDREQKRSLLRENQLAFELEEKAKRKKPESLKAGDASLEIAAPVVPEAVTDAPTPDATPKVEIGDGTAQPEVAAAQGNADHTEPYDPTLDLASYEHPTTNLLLSYDDQKFEVDRAELEMNKDQIIETLLNYKIEITKIRATIGPTVTLYEIVPAAGVRISKIKNLEDDIALSLAALGIRIIAPIPGRGTIGIEVPNKKKQIVSLKEVLMSEKFKRAKMDLPIALGKTINNEVFVADLAKMPHLLIAGATGQGKSVGINTIIMSLLYKKHPSQVKLVLVDPKKVELFPYAQLESHFLTFLPGADEPITTETNKVVHTLNSLCIEMDERYNLLKSASARNIREYNDKFVARRLNPQKGHRFLPFIVLVIDEFADLIMTAGKEIELPIGRLAQLARAIGIHLIIATQRPSVNIITGVIKANFPARLGFKVTSKIDSRTILDAGGADQLIGRGDMLLSVGGDMIRLQCAFVDTPEVEAVLKFIGDQRGYVEPYLLPEFHGDDAEHGSSGLKFSDVDENFEDAARLVVQNQHGSTSMIQRRLKLGYNRAGRIMDQMEALGIVGPSEGSKAREVLIYDEMELMKYIEQLKNAGKT